MDKISIVSLFLLFATHAHASELIIPPTTPPLLAPTTIIDSIPFYQQFIPTSDQTLKTAAVGFIILSIKKTYDHFTLQMSTKNFSEKTKTIHRLISELPITERDKQDFTQESLSLHAADDNDLRTIKKELQEISTYSEEKTKLPQFLFYTGSAAFGLFGLFGFYQASTNSSFNHSFTHISETLRRFSVPLASSSIALLIQCGRSLYDTRECSTQSAYNRAIMACENFQGRIIGTQTNNVNTAELSSRITDLQAGHFNLNSTIYKLSEKVTALEQQPKNSITNISDHKTLIVNSVPTPPSTSTPSTSTELVRVKNE